MYVTKQRTKAPAIQMRVWCLVFQRILKFSCSSHSQKTCTLGVRLIDYFQIGVNVSVSVDGYFVSSAMS